VTEQPPHTNSSPFHMLVGQSLSSPQPVSQRQSTQPNPAPTSTTPATQASSDALMITAAILVVPLAVVLGIFGRRRFREWKHQKRIQALERMWDRGAESPKD
jgi:H+/gluconate symporter-like permease